MFGALSVAAKTAGGNARSTCAEKRGRDRTAEASHRGRKRLLYKGGVGVQVELDAVAFLAVHHDPQFRSPLFTIDGI